MSFRRILVPLAGTHSDSAAIDAALLIGREFDAHIDALYAHTAHGDHANWIRSTNPIDNKVERADPMEAARVRALFLNRCKAYGVKELDQKKSDRLSIGFLELQGTEADLIAEHGRLSDLIVFAHPNSTDFLWPNISIQTALRETARPVLLVPSTVTQVGKCNMIAWNGSLEAVRAVALAIPVLLRGASTLVVTIGDHDTQPSGNKVVEYLKRHGIVAQSMVIPIGQSSEGSTLLATSATSNADLIILGAYTRYRTGRPMFGSMTIEMIKQNKIPVFMAH
jgi:nucleotide-binding universal stress UspA family protein